VSGRDVFDAAVRVRRRPPGRPAPLERVRGASAERFAAFRRASRPVLLDGVLDEWPDGAELTLAALRARFGDRVVSVMRTKDGRIEDDPRHGVAFDTVRFGDYLDRVERGEPTDTYLAAPGAACVPELAADTRRPSYCRNAAWVNSRFWLGPAGTCAPLHRDVAENIFVQLVGRKRFLLYPPAASPWLYSHAIRSALPNFSRFDPNRPDYDRFPLSRAVEPLELVLGPGDALYLPSRWWHHVRALDVSASVNFWFADGALALLVRAAEFVKRVRRLEIYGLEAQLGTRAPS
jgi:hypothetical protein